MWYCALMRYYQPFPAAIPLYEAGYPRVTHPSATNFEKQAFHRPFDLHVLGAPPAFILSQDRTLRPKYMGFEPVRSSQSIADRFRSIHMVLYRKRNFSGPPLGGLAKNKSKLDHFKWFDVCPDATQLVCPSSQYPVLKVHALRLIRSDRAARQGDILPDRRGAGGGNLGVHISYTIWDFQLYLLVIKRGPRFRDPLLRLSIEIGFQSLRPTACDRTLQSRQVLHQLRRHPRPWQRYTA